MQNSRAKIDEFKSKIMDLLHKQSDRELKIPAMGFTEYVPPAMPTAAQSVVALGDECDAAAAQPSDSEIVESIESVYFQPDFNAHLYELEKVLSNGLNNDLIAHRVLKLRTQHKVLSKQLLQNILAQSGACKRENVEINEIEQQLAESLWTCRKARSYLSYARTNLTTISLQILASYRKREQLLSLLNTLHAIRNLKTIEVAFHKLLAEHNYSAAISLFLDCKKSAGALEQYNCVQSFAKKSQETMLLLKFQLDTVLNEMVLNYDAQKYGKLQEAYKLLQTSLEAMDQLHINYISAIHSSVNAVVRGYIVPVDEEGLKCLYEQLCELVPVDKYVACLVSLCKTFWIMLSSYYQIVMWHSNNNSDDDDVDHINEKLKKSQSRIWNDIIAKTCTFLQSKHLVQLKHDQFTQLLSVLQRLKKVGYEFCGEQSEKLTMTIQTRSQAYFSNYHLACLEEVCLFLDNESWSAVDSVTNILQLPEFRSVRQALRRQKSPTTSATTAATTTSVIATKQADELGSLHSHDGESSIYGSFGYFLRFSEKSSPFDGGLDETMLEEDILAGIVDETSCYYSGDSDDEPKSMQSKSDYDSSRSSQLVLNNTTLNILRYIGRYLQLCKLLPNSSPTIVRSIFELLDFYAYAIHSIFCKDSLVQLNSFQTSRLERKFADIEANLLPHIKLWPLNIASIISTELSEPDTLYGLAQRIVAVESGNCLLQQLVQLQHLLSKLLPLNERSIVGNYFDYVEFMQDLARMIYTCVTSRMVDLQDILTQMAKVKWDVQNVSFQHNSYIDIMNRNMQSFALSLEDIGKQLPMPITQIWNSIAHVTTHLLVEGFSNAKKCSAAGRALMQLDFTNFMLYLELISTQKFDEHRAYVDGYIKAYYLGHEQLEDWLEAQQKLEQYSTKQLTNLVQCTCANDKRTRQRLLKLLNLLDTSSNVSLNVSNGSTSTNSCA